MAHSSSFRARKIALKSVNAVRSVLMIGNRINEAFQINVHWFDFNCYFGLCYIFDFSLSSLFSTINIFSNESFYVRIYFFYFESIILLDEIKSKLRRSAKFFITYSILHSYRVRNKTNIRYTWPKLSHIINVQSLTIVSFTSAIRKISIRFESDPIYIRAPYTRKRQNEKDERRKQKIQSPDRKRRQL